MALQMHLPLPRPIPLQGREEVVVTLDDAVHFLCTAAGRVKSASRIERATAAVMHAAITHAPEDLERAAKRLKKIAKRCPQS